MAARAEEHPKIDFYRLATSVRAAESKYLDCVYNSYVRRHTPNPVRGVMKNNADVLFNAIIASGVKRDLDKITQDLDLIIGGEDQSMLAGSEQRFEPEKMQYGLAENYGNPPIGTPVEIYSSQISRRTPHGEEVILNATCLRPGEVCIKETLKRQEPRMLKGSIRRINLSTHNDS